ncbi:MAG TPA: response regulator [Gemmatimonadaceae bacterium]|jgi:CheY-like chemotaxis protein|nr:response regulator [Gemmatimonadaceae bacterium]
MPAGESRQHILLVDDDPVMRAAISITLEAAGYDVTSVGRPSAAIAAFAGIPVDLLITDMMMPEMNGADLAAALRERDPTLRVMLISAYDTDEAMAGASVPAEVVFVRKDAAPWYLVPTVRALLAKRP